MSKFVIGLHDAATWEYGKPLRAYYRLLLARETRPTEDYFDKIAEDFRDLTTWHCDSTLRPHHIYFVLAGDELSAAIDRTRRLLTEYQSLPEEWFGNPRWEAGAKGALEPTYTIMRRRQLLAAVRLLRATLSAARRRDCCVVFGNGVHLKILLGRKPRSP